MGRLLFLVIGAVALSIGGWQGSTTATFVKHAIAATGRVMGDNGATSGQSGAHPAIEFRTVAGASVR